ncbi:MAG: hypothetical protein U0904_10025 [Candidatus Nanopelagicales bacterium]|nr:hypothetical protein [Candidatus Nanopelagicales bacterium]
MDTHLNLVPTYGAVGLPFGLTTGEVEVAWGSPDCVLDEGDGHIDWHYRHARTELCFQEAKGWRLSAMTCFDPDSTVAGCSLWDARMESVESALSDRLGESPVINEHDSVAWMRFVVDWLTERDWLELVFECGRLREAVLWVTDDGHDNLEWPAKGSSPDAQGWADLVVERYPDLEWRWGGLSIERGLAGLPFGSTQEFVRQALGAPDRVGRSFGDLVYEYWRERMTLQFDSERGNRLSHAETRHRGCLVEGRDLWRVEKDEAVAFLAEATSSVPDRYLRDGLNETMSFDTVTAEFAMDLLVQVSVFDGSEEA